MIPDEELEIKTLRDPKYNYGGQHVGVPNTPIQITHIPTGISATCGTGRSQMRNRLIALSMVEYGLLEIRK
jgi:protein subunit release factor A